MIKLIYKDMILFENKKKELCEYDKKTKKIQKINIEKKHENINIFIELCSILYRNTIINKFKEKGIDFRTCNFYETVCDVLFEYEEESEEYQLLNKFIILSADFQIT